MQIIKSQSQIVEKVLRDKEGRLVRAKFCIYENAGRIKARLIDFVYLDVKELAGKILNLVGNPSKVKEVKLLRNSSVRSAPIYSILNSIFYSGSKPRAPTFI